MKRSSTAVCLVIGLCLVSLPRPVLGAQDQSTQAATGTLPSPPSSLANLEKRLQDAEDELASIRQQLNTPLTVEVRRVLLERMEHLGEDLQHIRRGLNSVKEQRLHNSTTETSATSGCCELRDTSTQHGHTQMGSRSCRIIGVNRDAPSTSVAGAAAQTCLAGGRIIESRELKDLDISLTNDHGQLTRGQNSFCIDFSRLRNGSMTGRAEVQAEATMQMGQVKALRAVVRLSHSAVGHYCAHVDFPSAGLWFITVKYKGSSGKDKAVFIAPIN